LVVLFAGWVLTRGVTHAVTDVLVTLGIAGLRHHEAFHRFFSRGTWDVDYFGELLLHRIVGLLNGSPPRIVIDDTLAPHKGAHVFGIGSHIDAVHVPMPTLRCARSSKATR
jgi:hypothetical protein